MTALTNFAPPIYAKSEQERLQILTSLEGNFLSQNLAQTAMQTIVDSMILKKFKPGENIINQGDNGREYYILKKGKC